MRAVVGRRQQTLRRSRPPLLGDGELSFPRENARLILVCVPRGELSSWLTHRDDCDPRSEGQRPLDARIPALARNLLDHSLRIRPGEKLLIEGETGCDRTRDIRKLFGCNRADGNVPLRTV